MELLYTWKPITTLLLEFGLYLQNNLFLMEVYEPVLVYLVISGTHKSKFKKKYCVRVKSKKRLKTPDF